jgi:hypothetical protein
VLTILIRLDICPDFLIKHVQLIFDNCDVCFQKNGLMKQVAHQTIVMQYILELSKTMEVPPIACVPSFFTKLVIFIPFC